jgi:hypothetical protein
MKEHLFRKTQEDIRSYSKTLESVLEIGLEHGIPSTDLTLTNALQKTLKLSRDRLKHEALVQDLGYSSLGRALKALSQYKQGDTPTDISQLPEVFHRLPAVWLSGKPKTKKEPGFAPLRVRDAQRQHRVMAPLLLEAWDLADETVRDQITREYLTTSAPDFERALYRYIYDLEPLTLEEEFENILPDTDTDIAESLRLVTDPDIIYGVVKKNEDED